MTSVRSPEGSDHDVVSHEDDLSPLSTTSRTPQPHGVPRDPGDPEGSEGSEVSRGSEVRRSGGLEV